MAKQCIAILLSLVAATLTVTSEATQLRVNQAAGGCEVANLLNHVGELEYIEKFVESKMPIAATISEALAKLNVADGSKSFDVVRKHILGFDFDFKFTIKTFKVQGMSSLRLDPISITSEHGLKSKIGFDEDVKVDFDMELVINQLPTIGCREDEENYLGLCYKKCAILTGGSHPRRSATNTCTKAEAGFLGIHAPWTKGLGCNGFGVSSSGGCATPSSNYCLTEGISGLFRTKDTPCDVKTIQLQASVALQKPEAFIDANLEVLTCSDKTMCKNPDPFDFFKSLAMNHGVMKRVKAFSVKKAGVTLGENPDVNLNIDTQSITGTVLTIAFGMGKAYVKAKNLIPMVEGQISAVLTPALNSFIQSKLQPFFGNMC